MSAARRAATHVQQHDRAAVVFCRWKLNTWKSTKKREKAPAAPARRHVGAFANWLHALSQKKQTEKRGKKERADTFHTNVSAESPVKTATFITQQSVVIKQTNLPNDRNGLVSMSVW